jgi:ABC-type bacteriocin/lantibiotic exporter with double-glycine peptidase domain
MMDTTLFFIVLLVLIIYTLYWTWFNDFGLFLFISIIFLTGFFVYKYIDKKIMYWENKIDNIIDEQIQNINNIKSNIVGEQLTNLKNLKSSIFS